METKRVNLLIHRQSLFFKLFHCFGLIPILIFFFMSPFSRATDKEEPQKKKKSFAEETRNANTNSNINTNANKIKISVLILERASRIQLMSEVLEIPIDGHVYFYPIKSGQIIKNPQLKIFIKPVSINSEKGFLWIEFSLMDRDKKTLTYSVATVPDGKFSLGAGFNEPNNLKNELVLMLDHTL